MIELKLSEISGNNYFLLHNPRAIEGLNAISGRSRKATNEELKNNLAMVFGYRIADAILRDRVNLDRTISYELVRREDIAESHNSLFLSPRSELGWVERTYYDRASGDKALSADTLLALQNKTGIDPFKYVTKWVCGGNPRPILNPTYSFDDKICGRLFGLFLARLDRTGRICIRHTTKGDLIDLLESFGTLQDQLTILPVRKITSEELADIHGKKRNEGKSYESSPGFFISQQFRNIYKTILERFEEFSSSKSFCRNALYWYSREKGYEHDGSIYVSFPIDVKRRPMDSISTVVSKLSLRMTNPTKVGNQYRRRINITFPRLKSAIDRMRQ